MSAAAESTRRKTATTVDKEDMGDKCDHIAVVMPGEVPVVFLGY